MRRSPVRVRSLAPKIPFSYEDGIFTYYLANADRFTDAVQEKMEQLGYRGSQTQENGVRETTGPPMAKENTADDGGGLRYSVEDGTTKNEVVYDKKEMNGKYQVGSGRIVTVTHDTPFIWDIVTEKEATVKKKSASMEILTDEERYGLKLPTVEDSANSQAVENGQIYIKDDLAPTHMDDLFVFSFRWNGNYCSHQFLNWWQQMSTGHLHQNLQIPPPEYLCQIKTPPKRVVFLFGGEGGI